jgi:hypothetical protein
VGLRQIETRMSLSIHLSLFIHPSIHPSIYPSIYLSLSKAAPPLPPGCLAEQQPGTDMDRLNPAFMAPVSHRRLARAVQCCAVQCSSEYYSGVHSTALHCVSHRRPDCFFGLLVSAVSTEFMRVLHDITVVFIVPGVFSFTRFCVFCELCVSDAAGSCSAAK